MKIKVISRDEQAYTRERGSDVVKQFRNVDPKLHPFERAREYKRAVNAVKLDRVFAKPFVGQMTGHADGIWTVASTQAKLSAFLSGACDGEVRVWDLAHQKVMWSVYAHEGFVRGLAISPDASSFFSAGDDCIIKQWPFVMEPGGGSGDADGEPEPVATYMASSPLRGIDHHWSESQFVTAGEQLDVWDTARSVPLHSFTWGADSVLSARYNPAEESLVASTGADRSVCLYDLRGGSAVRKVVLAMRSNAVAWNPMAPMRFTVANEDNNLYTFDMRRLKEPMKMHADHLSAVMDVSYSPTGKEFVSGSYDRTVRIFREHAGHSRDVYHTRRMQRVFCVRYSADARFIVSGSDDTNLRLWKAQASRPIGRLLPRERAKMDYLKKLKARYAHHAEVKRIARHRHMPRSLLAVKRQRQIMREAVRRKQQNVMLHSKKGTIKRIKERRKAIVKELA
eukprot:PLAT9991.1.p1 GENE.PLAT9991.1~~PLAT9991.1.p1  ORF type:complete len:461 (-),score=156.38 PLAT9991.1:82-1437(-)